MNLTHTPKVNEAFLHGHIYRSINNLRLYMATDGRVSSCRLTLLVALSDGVSIEAQEPRNYIDVTDEVQLTSKEK